jgi:hypothetical protein
MQRSTFERYLADAERHAALGARLIADQRDRVAFLERRGQDATKARELLDRFEGLQLKHLDDISELRRKLGHGA